MERLDQVVGQMVQAASPETAPVLLEQYCAFHIPGTDEGETLSKSCDHLTKLVARKLECLLAVPETRDTLLRLSPIVLSRVLSADDLL
eukprot:2267483-Heterocapsa_arctica.AAC.1